MKKTIFLRALLGFPIGIAIGHILSMIGSLIYGGGGFYPCTPDLIALMGSEINAVMMQTFLCGLIGASFAASSVVWQKAEWCLAKQTEVYFLVNALVMLPAAYLLNWMEHSIAGFLGYFGVFLIYFSVIWAIWYLVWKQTVKKMNAKLRQLTEEEAAS